METTDSHTFSDFTAVRPMHDHDDYTKKMSAMELHRQYTCKFVSNWPFVLASPQPKVLMAHGIQFQHIWYSDNLRG